jgi:hypothetical protein
VGVRLLRGCHVNVMVAKLILFYLLAFFLLESVQPNDDRDFAIIRAHCRRYCAMEVLIAWLGFITTQSLRLYKRSKLIQYEIQRIIFKFTQSILAHRM